MWCNANRQSLPPAMDHDNKVMACDVKRRLWTTYALYTICLQVFFYWLNYILNFFYGDDTKTCDENSGRNLYSHRPLNRINTRRNPSCVRELLKSFNAEFQFLVTPNSNRLKIVFFLPFDPSLRYLPSKYVILYICNPLVCFPLKFVELKCKRDKELTSSLLFYFA